MNRTTVLLIGIVIALGLIAMAPSYAADVPTPLTLQDCINTALANQVDVLVGQNTVTASKARVTQQKGDYFPQVSVQTQTKLAGNASRGVGNISGTSLSITQNFYDGGLREARVSGVKAGVVQNTASLERTKQAVVFDVTQNYYTLLRQQHLAIVAETKVKYLQSQRDLVRTQVQVGAAAEVDILPIDAQLANANVDLLAAKNAVRTAGITLQQAMGLRPQPGFAIQDITEPVNQPIRPVDEYLALAAKHRPDIVQTKAGVQVAQSSVKQSKITMLPRPFVSGQFDNPLFGGGGSGSAETLITGGIAFSLFDGGSNRAAYTEARANLSSSQLRRQQLAKDIEADVNAAYLNLTDAKERMAASDLSLTASQKNADAQLARYKAGLAITLDLLNAQVDLATAQSNAVQARYDYYTSLAQLEFAIGKQGVNDDK
ncbi:MAG: TolC family protein [Armatimonadota bacterium]